MTPCNCIGTQGMCSYLSCFIGVCLPAVCLGINKAKLMPLLPCLADCRPCPWGGQAAGPTGPTLAGQWSIWGGAVCTSLNISWHAWQFGNIRSCYCGVQLYVSSGNKTSRFTHVWSCVCFRVATCCKAQEEGCQIWVPVHVCKACPQEQSIIASRNARSRMEEESIR